MRFSTIATAAAAATAVNAQRPKDTSICDYYTKALLNETTAENEATLLTLLVNTVVIGNYTTPNKNAVPGILAKGMVNNTEVNLAPYFSGALASTNRKGKAVSVNFLDDGGAEPLKNNKPANGKSSNQYFLLTHLYQFFGALLDCTKQGMTGFDAYMGDPSMYEVHKFMDLDYAQVTYFVEQVGLAAKSFGVADDDITAVANSLNSAFNIRCAPKTEIIKSQGSQLQSICIDKSCPQSPKNANCDAYDEAVMPKSASSTGSSTPTGSTGSSTPTGSSGSNSPTGTSGGNQPSGTASASSSPTTGAASKNNGLGVAALVAGVAAFAL